MTGVTWDIPSSLLYIDGQGTNCLKVTPVDNVPDGTDGVINYSAIMDGGCPSSAQSSGFTIFSSEYPPPPQGYLIVTLIPSDGYDPCDPETWVGYTIEFVGTPPYENGYTTVSPSIFVPVPHHINKFYTIEIEVCNHNICSGLENCITYTYDLPNPCIKDGEGGFGKFVMIPQNYSNKKSVKNESLTLREDSETGSKDEKNGQLLIYPNPFTKSFIVNFPYIDQGEIKVLNTNGQIVLNKRISHSNRINIELNNDLSNGIYIFKLSSEKYSYVKRILKQD